ncbi:hypothetical protein HYC85_021588 [Camellia sinensis]|uniref:Uncharacterized protein n=1 Tax=Camellia sinensis TaxID=4442 RepID=A0A7J7GKJ5_CAMSI|nr:hypothetical protein HYC85_021588 [Camellia sinensis]
MAPKKRSDEGEGEEKKPVIVKRELMVTRSSTRRLNGNSSTDSLSSPKPKYKPRTKKAKTSAKEDLKEQKVQVQTAEVKAVADDSSKTITRAIQVKNGLESGLSGVNVLVNPEKPRRGCFEIREEGGEKFISLLDMKRPFTPMKALDMDKVISDIIDKIK